MFMFTPVLCCIVLHSLSGWRRRYSISCKMMDKAFPYYDPHCDHVDQSWQVRGGGGIGYSNSFVLATKWYCTPCSSPYTHAHKTIVGNVMCYDNPYFIALCCTTLLGCFVPILIGMLVFILILVICVSYQRKWYSHPLQEGGRGISRWLHFVRLNQSWHLSSAKVVDLATPTFSVSHLYYR